MGLRQDGKMLNILFSIEMYQRLKEDADKRGIGIGPFIKSIIYDWYNRKDE